MSAGHLFAVSKINTLSRQGQGNLPLLFLCENFLRYNIGAFFRETATLSTTSVTAKIRESFLPVQFCGKSVLKSVAHSVATRYVGRSSVCCQQNKYVIEARAGQPAFSFNPHLQASGKHLLFFGKEVIIKIINKGKRLSVEIPLTYARTE